MHAVILVQLYIFLGLLLLGIHAYMFNKNWRIGIWGGVLAGLALVFGGLLMV